MMKELQKDVEAARAAAGHNAYRLVEEYGVPDARVMLRVLTVTYLRALAAVDGWPEAMALVQQEYSKHFVPPRGRNFHVVE